MGEQQDEIQKMLAARGIKGRNVKGEENISRDENDYGQHFHQ